MNNFDVRTRRLSALEKKQECLQGRAHAVLMARKFRREQDTRTHPESDRDGRMNVRGKREGERRRGRGRE